MLKHKLLQKMLFFYAGIVILYTLVISTYTCYKGFELASVQTKHAHQRYIEQTSTYIDNKLQIAFDLLYQMSAHNNFIDYRYNKTEDPILITDVFNDLYLQTKGFTHLGFTISVTKFTDDVVITPSGTFSHRNYLKTLGIDPDAFYDFIEAQNASGKNTYILPLSLLKSPGRIVILHRLEGNSKAIPVYFFLILDSAALLTGNTEESSGNFSLYTQDLIYCLNEPDADCENEILTYMNSTELPENIEPLDINGKTSYIYSSRVIPDLKYVYTTKPASLFPIIMSSLKHSLLPLLLLLLIGFALSYKAATSAYQPIRSLVKFVKEKSDTDPAPVSAADDGVPTELEYIHSNLEHIYELNHTLQNKLDQSLIRLQENFLRKVIYGIADDAYISDNIVPLHLEILNQPLRLLLLDFDGIENAPLIPYHNFSMLIHEVVESYSPLSVTSFILPLDSRRFCILVPETPDEILIGLGTHITDSITSLLSLDVIVCLSSTWHLQTLTSGLQELLMLANHKYTCMDQKVLTKEVIQDTGEPLHLYSLEAETCLINYINSNEYDKAKELLLELINSNLYDMTLSLENIKHLKYSLITTFQRCLNVDGKSLTQFTKEYPTAISDFLNMPIVRFKEGLLALFDVIFQYCNQNKFSLESPTASKIFMYIQENFDKDISLTDIADHFDLSESYISKLFKSSLDVNFKTYVNKLKIKKAKELFQNGSYKVNEVGAIVGCNNTNTFIRIFKQYEGISPGEYVKNLRRANL